MKPFLHKQNTDNVHTRAVIVGVINLLNGKIFYENVLGDDDIDQVYVPFIYNMGGDERFLQDYYLHWNDCIHPKFADGNYDVIPRGVVTMTSKSIDSSRMTHRFVRGTYVKEVNGELQQYSSYVNSLPITMNFDIEIETDTTLDAFKIEQSIMETFYKTQGFSVNFRGFRIPCQAGFSDEFSVDKTFEFSYQDNNRIIVKFTIEVETFYPVVDDTTTRSATNRISTGVNSVSLEETWKEGYTKPRFTWLQPRHDEKYFSGGLLPLSWTNTGPVMRVNIYYKIGNHEWRPIALNYYNVGYFNWPVPFFNQLGNEISQERIVSSVISNSGRGCKVRAIIDNMGEVSQIIILDKGLAYSPTDMIHVNTLAPPDDPAFVSPVIQANVIAGEVIGYTIDSAGNNFPPSPLSIIQIKIEDANNPDIHQLLTRDLEFIGDVDGLQAPPGNTYVNNCNPTVASMSDTTILVGLELLGPGIPPGSMIIQADTISNRIVINNNINQTISGAVYQTSSFSTNVEIQ